METKELGGARAAPETLDKAQARLDLLQDIHADFTRHLPTIEDADSGLIESKAFEIDRLRMQNNITFLRSDMSFLPYRLQRVKINQLSEADLERFILNLTQLLDLCERFVDEAASSAPQVTENEKRHVTPLSYFPKLLAFRQSLQLAEQEAANDTASIEQTTTKTTLYDMAKRCSDQFEELVSALQNYEETGLFSEEWSYDRFVGLRNSFVYWADYLGALAPRSTSLDTRLENHAEIRLLVWELLAMVDRNIRHIAILLESPPNSFKEAQHIFPDVDSAIARLHFLARAIRRASRKTPDVESLGFRGVEYELFQCFALAYVQRLFPDARTGLCEHMSNFMAMRRAALVRMQQHAQDLTEKQEVKPTAETGTKAGIQALRQTTARSSLTMHKTPFQDQTSVPKTHSPASRVILGLQSEFDKSRFREIYYKPSTVPIASSNYSRQDSKTSSDYPPPPQFKGEAGRVPCTFCREPIQINRRDLEKKRNVWTEHVDRDLQPYTCLFTRCKHLLFQHFSTWKDHMNKIHSQDWYKKIHTTTWICDIGVCQKTFMTENEWKAHMGNSEYHSPPPTELQLKALSVQKQKRGERSEHQCPFCESMPKEISKLRGLGNPSDVSDIFMKHIGDHVKFLSLIALPVTGDDGADSAEFQNSQRRLRKTDSDASLPSGAASIAQLSLRFTDAPEYLEVQLPWTKESATETDGIHTISSINDQPVPELDESFKWEYIWKGHPSGSKHGDLDISNDHIIQSMFKHMITARSAVSKSITDLDRAIGTATEALGNTPLDHPGRATYLDDLIYWLERRFELSGNIIDLNRSIRAATEAISITPHNHPDRAGRLNNLGNQLGRRFERSGEIADLDEAIQSTTIAVEITPLDHPDRASYLSNLEAWLRRRTEQDTATVLVKDGRDAKNVTEDNQTTVPETQAHSIGDVRVVKALLEAGVTPEEADKGHSYPLFTAVSHNNLEICKLLIETGECDLDSPANIDYNLLCEAVRKGHLEVLSYLISAGAQTNISLFDDNGNMGSPLAYAAGWNKVDAMRVLVQEGRADPNMVLPSGDTAAICAALYHSFEALEYLVHDLKVDPNAYTTDDAQYGSVLIAALQSEEKVDRYSLHRLATLGVDLCGIYRPSEKERHNTLFDCGSTLEVLVRLGEVNSVKFLIKEFKVNVNQISSSGRYGSALIAGICVDPDRWLSDRHVLADYLLEAGADVNLQVPQGRYHSAMSAAIIFPKGHFNTDIVRFLIGRGAKVNMQLIYGRYPSALMLAASKGQKDVVQLLIDNGADVHRSENSGWAELLQSRSAPSWPSAAPAAMPTQRQQRRDVLDRFCNHVHDNQKYGHTAQDTAISDPSSQYVPTEVLQQYWTEARVREVLQATGDFSLLLKDICQDYLQVFSILVWISRTESSYVRYLDYFTRNAKDDSSLPLTQRLSFLPLTGDADDFYKRFSEQQFRFCPVKLSYRGGRMHNRNLHPRQILPFVVKNALGQERVGRPAAVYLATLHDPNMLSLPESSQHHVVLKTYTGDSSQYDRELKAFTAFENGPHCEYIVRCLGSYFTQQQTLSRNKIYTLILEYADKGTLLDQYMANTPPVTFDETKLFWRGLQQVAQAVMVIHTTASNPDRVASCVHRDLKPSNILICSSHESGNPQSGLCYKICDFGNSHTRQTSGYSEGQYGYDTRSTRAYCPPEFRFNYDANFLAPPLVDMWSLGCILIETAVWIVFGEPGRNEFRERRKAEIAKNHPGMEDMGRGECYHNGSERLQCVTDVEDLVYRYGRASDTLTLGIVRLVLDNLLISDSKRYDSRLFYAKLIDLIDMASEPAWNRATPTHTVPFRSASLHSRGMTLPAEGFNTNPHPAPWNHYTATYNPSNGPPSSSSPVGSHVQPDGGQSNPTRSLPHRSSMFPSISDQLVMNQGESSYSAHSDHSLVTSPIEDGVQRDSPFGMEQHEQNQNHIPRDNGLELPDSRRVGTFASADSNRTLWQSMPPPGAENAPERGDPRPIFPFVTMRDVEERRRTEKETKIRKPLPGEDRAMNNFLKKRDHVFLIDNSKSMQKYKTQVIETFTNLAHILEKADEDGLDILCTSDLEVVEHSHRTDKLVKFVQNNFQNGASDFCLIEKSIQSLTDIIMRKLPKGPGETKNGGRFMSRIRNKGRQISIYILTDGSWTPDPPTSNTACGADRPIRQLIREIQSRNLSKTQAVLQFIRFGHDSLGIERLTFLDDGLRKEYPEHDIVDHKAATDPVWSILIGALDE